jgi:hypothetical protein
MSTLPDFSGAFEISRAVSFGEIRLKFIPYERDARAKFEEKDFDYNYTYWVSKRIFR